MPGTRLSPASSVWLKLMQLNPKYLCIDGVSRSQALGVGQVGLDERPHELLSMLNLKKSAPRVSPDGRTHQSAPRVSWSGIGLAFWR
jgi:hypothetical protein